MRKHLASSILIPFLLALSPSRAEPPAKKAVLMIVANYSKGEVEAASKAAAARGEQFISIPELTPEIRRAGELDFERETMVHRTLIPLYRQQADLEKKQTEKNKAILEPQIAALTKKTEALEKRNEEMKAEVKKLKKEAGYDSDFALQIQSKLDELKSKGVSVDSIAISGHDGGGDFNGTFGELNKTTLRTLADNNPEFKAGLRSAYLMGCYTATTKEIRDWKVGFPNVDIVAGYDDQSPLRDAPKGWNYIHDAMVLEKKLVDAKDAKELEQVTHQIRDLDRSGGALSTFPACQDPSQQKQLFRGTVTKGKVKEFNVSYCTAALKDLEKNNAIYAKYESGDLPLPADKDDKSPGSLRSLYSFYRQYEICIEAGIFQSGPKVEEVRDLLFNENVRANFFNYYLDSIAEVKKLADMIPDDKSTTDPKEFLEYFPKKHRFIQLLLNSHRTDAENQEYNDLKEYLKTHPPKPDLAAFKELANHIADPKYFQSMSRFELKYMAKMFEIIGKAGGGTEVTRVGRALDRYVVAGRCVPFSWIEPATSHPSPPTCEGSTIEELLE